MNEIEEIKGKLVIVSRVFANAKKEMATAESKTFIYLLENIEKQTPGKPGEIKLDKKELAKRIGINSDTNHLSQDIKRSIGTIDRHAHIEFESEDGEEWESGNLITKIRCNKNTVTIKITPDYLPLFENLDKDYISLWSKDIYSLSSDRAITFYEFLRAKTFKSDKGNYRDITVEEFKNLFNIPTEGPGSYIRPGKGKFNRPGFEKYIINPICEELTKTELIKICLTENGDFYEKIKEHGQVKAYRITWQLTEKEKFKRRQAIKKFGEEREKERKERNGKRFAEIADEKQEKQNKIIKSMNRNSGINQRNYDYDELEKMLIRNSKLNN